MGLSIIPNFKHPNVSPIGKIFVYDIHATFRKLTDKSCRLVEYLNQRIPSPSLRYKVTSHCIHIDTYKCCLL